MVPCDEAAAIRIPSGEREAQIRSFVYSSARGIAFCLPAFKSQNRIVLSEEEDITCVESEETRAEVTNFVWPSKRVLRKSQSRMVLSKLPETIDLPSGE